MLQTQIDFDPGDHLASVVAIFPKQVHVGKLLFEWQEQGSAPFGALGSCHFDGQQIALAVNEQVPFAPPDFLASGRAIPTISNQPAIALQAPKGKRLDDGESGKGQAVRDAEYGHGFSPVSKSLWSHGMRNVYDFPSSSL